MVCQQEESLVVHELTLVEFLGCKVSVSMVIDNLSEETVLQRLETGV